MADKRLDNIYFCHHLFFLDDRRTYTFATNIEKHKTK